MIKQPHELVLMAESGRLLASVFEALNQLSLEGMSTLQVNDWVERFIVDRLQARPASKGQYGFAYVLNSSIDTVVCHGVPSSKDILRNGSIVNLDITLEATSNVAVDASVPGDGVREPDLKANVCARVGRGFFRCVTTVGPYEELDHRHALLGSGYPENGQTVRVSGWESELARLKVAD